MHDSTNLNPPEKQSYSWNQVWITALTQPFVKSYEALIEDPKASAKRAVIWLFVSLSLPLFFVMLVSAIAGTAFTGSNILIALFCVPALASFYIWIMAIRVRIIHAIAKAVGGEGQFGSLFYAFAAFETPLVILAGVFITIGILNFLVLFLGLYGLVLSVIATMAVHRLNTSRAIVASFLGLVVVLIGVAIPIIIILALIPPTTGPIFSEIRNTLTTP